MPETADFPTYCVRVAGAKRSVPGIRRRSPPGHASLCPVHLSSFCSKCEIGNEFVSCFSVIQQSREMALRNQKRKRSVMALGR